LSRPKRNITRDFSDGVLMAEVMHHFFPRDVDVKNYSAANSVRQKLYNWQTLIHKVFRKLSFPAEKSEVDAIVACKPGAIESLLVRLQDFIALHRQRVSESGGVEWAHAAGSGGGGGGGSGRGVYAGGGGGGFGARQQSAGGPSAEEAARAAEDAELLAEKDKEIAELTEHVEILELKVKKLEQVRQGKGRRAASRLLFFFASYLMHTPFPRPHKNKPQLVRLKDSRIATLSSRIAQP
jgi:hypothetical protein